MADLSSARTRLMTALAAGAAAKAPSDAAMAQVSFDCWMQEAEENLQPKHIAACRKGYDASMARVDQAIAPKTVSMRAPAPPPPPAPSAPQTRSFVVYFGLGSDKVPASSAAILNEAAAFAKAKKSGCIYVTGHTDRAGSFKYNMDLAKKRAASVTKALTEMGIKKGAVGSLAQGEVSPAVETRDGVKEPRNRRVEISIVY